SSRNRAKQVPEGAIKNPPRCTIDWTASSTSPLKNRMPRIWRAGVINGHRHPTSNSHPCHAIVGRPPRPTPISNRGFRENGPNDPERPIKPPHPLPHPKHSEFALSPDLISSPRVENVLTPQKPAEAAPLSRERFPPAFALSVLFLAALWFGLCRELSGEWSVNEQYNFGWFVPFFALCLFWLRWQDRPQIEIR